MGPHGVTSYSIVTRVSEYKGSFGMVFGLTQHFRIGNKVILILVSYTLQFTTRNKSQYAVFSPVVAK
jgi:hypothetical protein